MKTNQMKVAKSLIILAFLTGLFYSCKNNTETIEPTSVTYESLNDYLETRAPIGEDFEISGEAGGVLNTAKGSVITIPANAFITQSGVAVTGLVNIRMKEIFSNAGMIFSRVFPISNSSVLNSGGEFFIQATQNGNILRVADGLVIEVDIPAQAFDNQMQLFLAGQIEEVDDSINWVLPDSLLSPNMGFVFNSADNSYEITLDSLGWGNIDAFNSTVSYFDCSFNLTGIAGLNNTNTTAFAVFKDMNTVWPVGSEQWGGLYGNITNNLITESHLADVPLNLIIISVVNNQLYYGLLDVTPQDGGSYTIQMSTVTSDELDVIISDLP